MPATRKIWYKNLFFWAPQEESEEEMSEVELGIDAEKRKETERKLKEIENKFFELKRRLQETGMLNLFFVKGEVLFKKMDEAFTKVPMKKEAYLAFNVFLDNMNESTREYQLLSDRAIAVINTKNQLRMPNVPEAEKVILNTQLTAQLVELNNKYGDFIVSSGKLIESSLQLVGKTSWFKILGGIGLAVAGSLIIGAAALLFISTASTSMPLSALVTLIGVDLILSGVGIAIGATVIAIGAAAVIGGSILGEKGKQHGLSKDAFDASKVAEKEVNILISRVRL